MVGKYSRKSTRQSWDEDAMQRAIEAVNAGEMGWQRAAVAHGVPQATLRRRAQGKNKFIQGSNKGMGRFHTTFHTDVERELVDHLKLLESRLFGLTANEIRQLAYQLAEKNGISHRFNPENKMAGWDWLRGFRKRNPDIGPRKPEATSLARAMGFNRVRVTNFFEVYQETVESHNISPTRIFNMDESALSTVHKPPKVYAEVGKKQVGAITSAERGMHVTMVCCMSTTGQYVPPTLIFPRKNWKKELTDNAPLGTLGLAHETGYMTGEVFLTWLKHFSSHVKPSLDDKVLLILDGHTSHKQLNVLLYAKENGIVMLCLPPHCTHRMQPLDVSFFVSIKTFYDQEVRLWLKMNPGRAVTQYQISGLFAPAYAKAATVANAESGFRNTGIWPVNPDIFPDYLFAPAETTNLPLDAEQHACTDVPLEMSGEEEPVRNAKATHVNDMALVFPSTSCQVSIPSRPDENQASPQQTDSSKPMKYSVSVADISPVPSLATLASKRKPRKTHGSVELTSSPFVNEVQKQDEEKKQKELRKTSRNVKRRLDLNSEDVFEEELFDNADDDDCPCLYCNELFSLSKPGANWLQCMKCKSWAHCECAGLPKKAKKFICELCE